MSIESKVFEKLFNIDKVELASQKVELALADDIESSRNGFLKNIDSAKGSFNKAQSSLIGYKDSLGNIAQGSNEVIRLISQLKTKSKELGIDLPAKYLVLEKEASQINKQYTAKYNAIDAMIKSM